MMATIFTVRLTCTANVRASSLADCSTVASERCCESVEMCVQVQVFGQDVLDYYSLSGYSSWEFVAYELLFFIGFFVLCWFALAFKKHQKR